MMAGPLGGSSFLPSGAVEYYHHDLALPDMSSRAGSGDSPLLSILAPLHSLRFASPPPGVAVTDGSPPASTGSDEGGGASIGGYEQAVQRLALQNGRIREAWEAERKHLEASRERAEEVYKEERALMEEERAGWEAEREGLLRQIAALQRRVANTKAQDGGRDGLGAVARQGLRGGGGYEFSHGNGAAHRSARGGGWPRRDLPAHHQPPLSFAHHSTARTTDLQRPSSLADPPPRASIQSPPRPACHPESMTPPLDEPAPPAAVPTVDVQHIIPSLEGIPIKATAIKKPTFTDARLTSSSSSSKPASPATSTSPVSREQQTLQVLAAGEARRLTMHAGHTPSHSMSALPDDAPDVLSVAVASSGDATPTLRPEITCASTTNIAAPDDAAGPISGYHAALPLDCLASDHPEPILVAADDPELKGPLMVRNMPAHDEVFFKRLSDRLEEVSRASDAAVPAVLKESSPEARPSQARKRGPGSGDAAGRNDDDMDIPLKLRKSNNFGAPFGEIR